MFIFLQAFYLILPLILAGIVQSIVPKNNWLPRLNIPIDFNKTLGGKPIFGLNKSWRGMIVMTLGSVIVVYLQAALYSVDFFKNLSLINYESHHWVIVGVLLSLGYLLAELPNSFIKRRLNIGAGAQSSRGFLLQYFVDQADSCIGVAIVLVIFLNFDMYTAFVVFVVGLVVHILFDQTMYRIGVKQWSTLESPFAGSKALFIQVVIWPGLLAGAKILYRARITSHLNLPYDPKARYIIVANHQSAVDSFVITAFLGLSNIAKISPIRYMTANDFLRGRPYSGFIRALGSFPAYKTNDGSAYGLELAKSMLQSGHTVSIYPEGKRTLHHITKPKYGVSVLANEPNVYVIPVFLDWRINSSGKKRVSVVIGQRFKAKGYSPEKIMQKVYGLSRHDSQSA